jgi:hypothetical protein
MLHTRYKDRLRQGLSYPLGLQDLDKALSDIPEAADLYVSFVASPLPANATRFYPVASVRRAQARKALIETLPLVCEWFSRTRPESWYHGRKVCEVWFEPAEGTIKVNDIVEAV